VIAVDVFRSQPTTQTLAFTRFVRAREQLLLTRVAAKP
jgi:hypothetical protein